MMKQLMSLIYWTVQNPKFMISHRAILKKNSQTAENLVIAAKKKIEEISKKEGLSGIPSGFNEIDKLTSGWQQSDLIIIAARPGMGKTAFTLSMARNISVENNFFVIYR